MDARERVELDRFITGNYGENQFVNADASDYDGACLCHDSIVCPDEIADSLEEEYPREGF